VIGSRDGTLQRNCRTVGTRFPSVANSLDPAANQSRYRLGLTSYT
jgi:hypothetical protein